MTTKLQSETLKWDHIYDLDIGTALTCKVPSFMRKGITAYYEFKGKTDDFTLFVLFKGVTELPSGSYIIVTDSKTELDYYAVPEELSL